MSEPTQPDRPAAGSRRPKIVVVGDYNTDLVLYFERLPQPGETLNARRFFEGPGGKGSNQAIAAARLGAEVVFVGGIGTDTNAEIATAAWAAAGVDTRHVLRTSGVETAVAMIFVDAEGSNCIGVNQGANLALSVADVEAAAAQIAAADVLLCTLGLPLPVVQQALAIARRHGTTTIMNTAPAAALTDAILATADILTPNERELAVIAGPAAGATPAQAAAGDPAPVVAGPTAAAADALVAQAATGFLAQATAADAAVVQARRLLRRPGQTVVITLGSAGARWVTATDSGLVPAFAVTAVDTVGAGDAFNAALAVAVAEGRPLASALRFAAGAAAISVTRPGAVDGMPTRAECDTFLSSAC